MPSAVHIGCPTLLKEQTQVTQTNTRRTIDVAEVGRILGISRNLAYTAVRDGTIPSLKIGKRVVVPLEAFERYIASNTSGGIGEGRG
jgi:excisionase family DNA binding protein